MNKRSHAILVNSLAYIVAALSSAYSLKYISSSDSELLDILYGTSVGSAVIFFACVLYDNISIYDPYWTIQATCISLYYLKNWLGDIDKRSFESHDLRFLIVVFLLNIWSFRLNYNLLQNGLSDINHEDWRYKGYRSKVPSVVFYYLVSLVLFIIIPTLLVYLGCFPIHNVYVSNKELNNMDLIASLITLFGIIFEAVGDSQLRIVINENAKKYNKTPVVIERGLWTLCRHPNYFGEVTFWFGLFIFSVAAGTEITWLQVSGPVGIFSIIYFGSLPMMEERQLKNKNELYTKYMKRVPFKLFPLNFFHKNHEKI